ncbi:hypothetical protein PCC79_07295 [Propioniciclava soli]|uniref:Uncharacterized protein n=1 Tax=Propioniciclava soli TaxID=2775081 RepID=A0ABZ3CEG9_9ACTN
MEETRAVTVGPPVEGGWRVVDDAGRPLVLARSALDARLVSLRTGQRLIARMRAGAIVAASLP